jgi:hypothetical protein
MTLLSVLQVRGRRTPGALVIVPMSHRACSYVHNDSWVRLF